MSQTPARHREYCRIWRKTHPRHLTKDQKAHAKKQAKAYYAAKREEINKRQKAYYHNLSDEQKVLKRNRSLKSYNKHRDAILARRANRWITDPHFNLSIRLRIRLRHLLLHRSIPKTLDILSLIGCSIDELRSHIERKFSGGMSWSRMSEIEIDHIRPCCSFDLTKLSHQRACFHYSNLQPLWTLDNRRKGSKHL